MRILILTQWYPPDPNRIFGELAESLHVAGHEVTVLTAIPNYPFEHFYPGYRLKLWQKETMNGVTVIRIPLYPSHARSIIKRSLNYLSFLLSLATLGPWLAPRCDVIYVIHPPMTIVVPAWIISRLSRTPFVLEVQDMWPETLQATGMLHNNFILGLLGRLAKWAYRRAAAIRVISPGFRSNLVEKGVPAEKIHVISNWVDTNLFRPVERNLELSEKLGLAARFNIMYAGSIGAAQGIETVLEAAALLSDLPDVQFVLVGGGIEAERIQALVRERRLSNVRLLGRYPVEEIPALQALADVLLIHLRDDPLFRITVPHKVFVCLASAKPILAAIEGDTADIVRSAQAGLTCPPGNPQAMADTVRRFYCLAPTERAAMAQNGLRAAQQSFTCLQLVGQIAEMLEKVVSKDKSRCSSHSPVRERGTVR